MNKELGYNIDSDQKRKPQALASNLSSMVLEGYGITPFIYCSTPQDTVISPAYGNDDIASFKLEKPIHHLEQQATLKIKEIILSQDEPFAVVWISPPDEKYGYKEGRLQVGFGRKQGYIKVVENYGIRVNWSAQDCLSLGNNLAELSDNEEIASIDKLRSTAFNLRLPPDIDPVDFIAGKIDLPEVWEEIKNGEAKRMQEKAVADANRAVEKLFPQVQTALTKEERVAAGSAVVGEMQSSGWDISPDICPGSFYSESVSAFASFNYQVGENGSVNLVSSELGVFCRECPYCHRTINKIIYPGFRCACGEVFTGACGGGRNAGKGKEENAEENLVVNLIELLLSFIFMV